MHFDKIWNMSAHSEHLNLNHLVNCDVLRNKLAMCQFAN